MLNTLILCLAFLLSFNRSAAGSIRIFLGEYSHLILYGLIGINLVVVCYLFVAQHGRQLKYFFMPPLPPQAAKFMLALVLFKGLSMLWSKATGVESLQSMWYTELAYLGLTYVMAMMIDVNRLVKASFLGWIIGCLFMGLTVAMNVAATANNVRLGSDELVPTAIGNCTGMAFVMCFYFVANSTTMAKRAGYALLGMLMFGITLMCIAKTSLAGGLVAMFIFLKLNKSFSPKLKIAFLGGLALVALSLLPKVLPYFTQYDKLASLTGRTDVWERAWSAFPESPFWGHGLGSFMEYSADLNPLTGGFYHTHNEWLNLLFHYGLIGILLYGTFLVTYTYQIMQALKSEKYRLAGEVCLCLNVYFLLKTFAESGNQTTILYSTHFILLTSLWISPSWQRVQERMMALSRQRTHKPLVVKNQLPPRLAAQAAHPETP